MVSLVHDLSEEVNFTIEVNPIGHGPWMVYKEMSVRPGETLGLVFENDFEARWVRLISDADCIATAWFVYE